jgi:hypothetical protein
MDGPVEENKAMSVCIVIATATLMTSGLLRLYDRL